MEGEIYHLYTRGVEKRIVFENQNDYERFLLLLYVCNRKRAVRVDDLVRSSQGEPLRKAIAELAEEETLVDILCYSLMPNHLHILVREKNAGISKLMLKLMTAYVMYFNTKYARSGPLFTRPFRSKHIPTNDYFRWAFAYVLLNPLDVHQSGWRTNGISDKRLAAEFIKKYRYGSFPDYFAEMRPEGCIVDANNLPFDGSAFKNFDSLVEELSSSAPSYQENTFEAARSASSLV